MDFEIPASLDGLDLDALAELETQAVAAFDALRDDQDLDATGLTQLRELATFVQSVRTQQQQIEQAALQVASELDDLDVAVHGAAEGPDGEGDDADNDGDGIGGDGDGGDERRRSTRSTIIAVAMSAAAAAAINSPRASPARRRTSRIRCLSTPVPTPTRRAGEWRTGYRRGKVPPVR